MGAGRVCGLGFLLFSASGLGDQLGIQGRATAARDSDVSRVV